MKRQMPISLIAAETLIAFVIVYMATMLVQEIRYTLSTGESVMPYAAIWILTLGWSVAVFLGIPFRWRTAWSVGRVASAVCGTVEALCGVLALFLLVCSGEFPSFFLWPLFSTFFAAIYLFLVYYLLSCPSAESYFRGEDSGESGKGDVTDIGKVDER